MIIRNTLPIYSEEELKSKDLNENFSYKKVTGRSLFTAFFKKWIHKSNRIVINPPNDSNKNLENTWIIQKNEIEILRSSVNSLKFESLLKESIENNIKQEEENQQKQNL